MLKAINRKMSSGLLAGVALVGMLAATLSVQSACWFFVNQPKVPEKLMKNN